MLRDGRTVYTDTKRRDDEMAVRIRGVLILITIES